MTKKSLAIIDVANDLHAIELTRDVLFSFLYKLSTCTH